VKGDAVAAIDEIRPLIKESSTSESTNVEVTMLEMKDGTLWIPDYQRDSDQWDDTTKSLFIESVINNLSIPAFFFEPSVVDGIEKNQVVDGQQRLTTLFEFYLNKFRLVSSDDATYLTPHNVNYAGKTLDELPAPYQQAFKRYRLTIIKLRELGDMRLEVFRRINQGGTPLSGQDIRLAVNGSKSPCVSFIRLVGVYDKDRQGAQRFIRTAKESFGLGHPWTNAIALGVWRDWWLDKDIALGQTPSEMFLWALVSAQIDKMSDLLGNESALRALNVRFQNAIDQTLDVYCAQTNFQDNSDRSKIPPVLMTIETMQGSFFPKFQEWISRLLGENGPSLPVRSYRTMAAMIGAAYGLGVEADKLSKNQWGTLVEFIRTPPKTSEKLRADWPVSKGRWEGKRGHKAQFQAARTIWQAILK
jgi:hypothetical protein